MTTINPYLNFGDKTEKAFNFYKSVFGGEFCILQRYKDMPSDMPDAKNLSEGQKERILHVSLPIGNGNVLMGSDSPESMPVTFGNNFHISINTESKEEAKRIYDKLSAGGKIQMPIADTFWGSYFGMFVDKFGIGWMVSFEYKK